MPWTTCPGPVLGINFAPPTVDLGSVQICQKAHKIQLIQPTTITGVLFFCDSCVFYSNSSQLYTYVLTYNVYGSQHWLLRFFKDEEQVLKDAKTTIKISAYFYFHRQFNGIFEDIFRRLICWNNCGFWSNRTLHYFPLSSSLSVCASVCHRRDISTFLDNLMI